MREPDPADVARLLAELADRATAALARQGSVPASVGYRVDCRYVGQAHEVPVIVEPVPDLARLARDFAQAHRARFGWDDAGEPIELVTFRAQATGPDPCLRLPEIPAGSGARALPGSTPPAYLRGTLGAGDTIVGPCLVWGDDATIVVDGGWEGRVDRHGSLLLKATA